MNNKGNGISKSYIIVFVILLIGVLAMFGLLEMAKNERMSKPLVDKSTTSTIKSTTTTSTTTMIPGVTEDVTTTTTLTTTKKAEEPVVEPIAARPFEASLEEIIADNEFLYDYKVAVRYSGAEFNFNCTKYDEKNYTCLEGSGLMNTGSALIPLYTYKNEDNNYLNNREDYYIILNNENIIIITNKVGKRVGSAKIYDLKGEYISTIPDVITGYKMGDRVYNRLYPSFTDNKFFYYTCDGNVVKIASTDIKNTNKITYEENIENATCN